MHVLFQVDVEEAPEARKQSNAYRASPFSLVRSSCSRVTNRAAGNGAKRTKRVQIIAPGPLRGIHVFHDAEPASLLAGRAPRGKVNKVAKCSIRVQYRFATWLRHKYPRAHLCKLRLRAEKSGDRVQFDLAGIPHRADELHEHIET